MALPNQLTCGRRAPLGAASPLGGLSVQERERERESVLFERKKESKKEKTDKKECLIADIIVTSLHSSAFPTSPAGRDGGERFRGCCAEAL